MRATLYATVSLAALLIGSVARAQAQPPASPEAAALFDDSQLQEIRLVVNPRDWADLKANFQSNTYYTAHFIWRFAQTLHKHYAEQKQSH